MKQRLLFFSIMIILSCRAMDLERPVALWYGLQKPSELYLNIKKETKNKINDVLDISSDHARAIALYENKSLLALYDIDTQSIIKTFPIIHPDVKYADFAGRFINRDKDFVLQVERAGLPSKSTIIRYNLESGLQESIFVWWNLALFDDSFGYFDDKFFFNQNGNLVMFTKLKPQQSCLQDIAKNCSNLMVLENDLFVFSRENKVCILDRLKNFLVERSDHTGAIAAFSSSDCEIFASASYDKTVRIWRKKNPYGECLALLRHGYPVVAVCLQKNGNYCATGTGYEQGAIYLWDMNKRERLFVDRVSDARPAIPGYFTVKKIFWSKHDDSIIAKDSSGHITQYLLEKQSPRQDTDQLAQMNGSVSKDESICNLSDEFSALRGASK